MAYAVEMKDISKKFGGLVALHGVTLQIEQGTIHALVGENGAGKSTLMNILCGKYSSHTFSGSIDVNGAPVRFASPKDANRAGVTMVHQELALIPELSVAENMYLGNQPKKHGMVDWKRMNKGAREALKNLSLDIDPTKKVKFLSVGQQQLVEICKAIMRGGRIMILDEPTSPLSDREIEFLFQALEQLRKQNITIIYITHRLEEIFRLADRVSIMRDGQMVATCDVAQLDKHQLVSYMIGREMKDFYPKEQTQPKEEFLAIKNYHVRHPVYKGRHIVDNIHMTFRKGEIVGISGLLGAGRTELMSALTGSYISAGQGEVWLDGKPVRLKSPADAIRHGIGYVTEDRKGNGLILAQTIRFNISLAHLDGIKTGFILSRRKENRLAREQVERLKVKTGNIGNLALSLSGGNQQKVVLAKWLATQPQVLILDEPTRGVDVGAKYEIYAIMKKLALEGVTIIMVSSDLPEIIGMSDRVYVMYEGKLAGELPKEQLNETNIMRLASGAAYEDQEGNTWKSNN